MPGAVPGYTIAVPQGFYAVTFVDGDPDRPIVTGCLYNGAHTPPWGLPGEKTKSGIKSESSPGGGGSPSGGTHKIAPATWNPRAAAAYRSLW